MKVPKYITDFMKAVYGDRFDLVLSSFNERKALRDATARINELEAYVAELEFELEDIRKDQ